MSKPFDRKAAAVSNEECPVCWDYKPIDSQCRMLPHLNEKGKPCEGVGQRCEVNW